MKETYLISVRILRLTTEAQDTTEETYAEFESETKTVEECSDIYERIVEKLKRAVV